jgi:hypothetical protein
MRLAGWVIVGLGCGVAGGCGSKSTAPSKPPKILPIQYDERPEMSVDTLWGGWTDGTSYYTIDGTTPDGGTESWGMQSILTIAPTDAAKDPGFGKDSFDALVNKVTFPKGWGLDAVLHAKGWGYSNAGAWLGYDAYGIGEDLSMYAEGGVVFYAKAGTDPNAPTAVTLMFVSPDFVARTPSPVGSSPDLSAHCGNPGYGACWDTPTITVQLGPEWWQYIVPFWAMRQNGTGYPVADFFEARGLQSDPVSGKGALTEFSLPQNVPFDFWIAGFGYYTKANYDKVAN